jgi:hypothetical membrane protein
LPENKAIIKQRMGAATGIAAPILAFVCILTSVTSYPKFSWTKNALSDLGISPGITGSLFNFGLYASGFLGLYFALFGLFSFLGNSWVGKIGSSLFAATSMALISIGVFNESFQGIHFAVSIVFFVLAPISMFVITWAFLLAHQTKMAIFTVLIGIAAALPWIFQFTINFVPNVAVPEFLSGLAISIWTVTLSVKMIRQTNVK